MPVFPPLSLPLIPGLGEAPASSPTVWCLPYPQPDPVPSGRAVPQTELHPILPHPHQAWLSRLLAPGGLLSHLPSEDPARWLVSQSLARSKLLEGTWPKWV